MPNIYVENGYRNRDHYLASMAEDYGCPLDNVLALADVLGPDEDFDGLVIALADWLEVGFGNAY